ncbi:MAG: ATP-binding protein [Nocardioides sp.]
MRSPGLLGRSIVASVLVAAVAIVATALLTLNVTQGSLERQRVQREDVDRGVVARVLAFGRAHPDWDGVDGLLRRLPGHDERLVLTDLHGRRIAATGPGRIPSSDPTAVLNPLGTVTAAGAATIPTSYRDLGLPRILLDDRTSGSRLLTAAREYPAIAVCYRRTSVVTTSTANLPHPVVFVSTCSGTGSVANGAAKGVTSLASLNNAVVLDESRCLDRRGVHSLMAQLVAAHPQPDTPTLASVSIPSGPTSATGTATRQAWQDCSTAALTRELGPVVAPEALLYIVRSRPTSMGIVDRIGRIRITAALAAVLLAAVAASLLASRQVLTPVRRLTLATEQMARGRLSTRVETRGRDQVATLGRSFNAMAEALATAEQQRRRMVDDVAHELRTPLANIRGYLEAGQDGVLPRDESWNASLLEEATLLQQVVDDLQTLAEADAGRLSVQPDTTDLNGTVAQAVRAMSGYAVSRGVRLELTADEVAAPHDGVRLRQVVGNLLANAIRHAPPSSVVHVDLRGTDHQVTLTVRDHGPGIAPEHLPHVFERFYRADPSRTRDTGGSGLGLAIVEQLVAAHAGTVTAANDPDGGAVLEVRLPRP